MDRILANVSGGREEADKNLDNLQRAFPDYEFKVRDHETRHQIVLVNAATSVPVPDVERMQRFAQGAELAPEEVEAKLKEAPKPEPRGQDSSFKENSPHS